MRPPGVSPVIAATRSDCRPAQAITFAASTGPRVVSSATSCGPGRIAFTPRPRGTVARAGRGEPAELGAVHGDHELATALERHVMLLAEALERLLALAAQARLQGARRVVQPRVDHAGVAAGLGARGLRLLLDHHHRP